MAADHDPAVWMTKEEASAELTMSTKTLEKRVRDGKLEQRTHRPARGAPYAVVRRDDVARLAAATYVPPRSFLVPGNGNGPTPA